MLTVFGGLFLILRQNNALNINPVDQLAGPQQDNITPVVGQEINEGDTLGLIKMAFDQGDYHQFYRQLTIVIDQWMYKKYGADPSTNWQNSLQSAGVDNESINQIASLKNSAAIAMYTPFIMDRKMIEDLESLQKIIA